MNQLLALAIATFSEFHGGLTQIAVAKFLGVSTRTLQRHLKGETDDKTIQFLTRLSFDVTISIEPAQASREERLDTLFAYAVGKTDLLSVATIRSDGGLFLAEPEENKGEPESLPIPSPSD